jgi:hypothetical protein
MHFDTVGGVKLGSKGLLPASIPVLANPYSNTTTYLINK